MYTTCSLLSPSTAAWVGLLWRVVKRVVVLIAVAEALTACSPPTTAALLPTGSVSQGHSADVTLRWNAFARGLIVTGKPNQQEALRALAYLSLAQHEAIVSLSTGIHKELEDTRATRMRGAIAGASAAVLTEIFKSSAQAIAAQLDAEASASAQAGEIAEAFELGVDEGRKVGNRIAAAARMDNFDAQWTGTVPTGPGVWFSSIGRAPLLPMLGTMRTFFMTSGSEFRPAAPPAFASPEYVKALAEIRAYSDTRTATQDSIAKFWAMATGTLAAGYWNEVAAGLIAKYHLNEMRAAHVLALMNTAAMDGNIACHDAKYTYWMIRPSQADTGIRTAIGLPNHPSYPSNHACVSGTAAIVLGSEFPQERAEMDRQANEATVSRYYAGLHYRFDGDAGLEIARKVAALALRVDREMSGRLILR